MGTRVLPAALAVVGWLGLAASQTAATVHRVPGSGPAAAAVARAPADDPVVLSRDSQITDRVDALAGRRPAVLRALGALDAQGLQLFPVYVRDFSGRTARDWAEATARRNGLGRNDVLLAVATHDRQYAYWVDAASPLTDAQLARVADTAVEPALRVNDWAGAAIGAADGYRAVLTGRAVPAPALTPGDRDPGGAGSAGSSASDLVLPAAVLIGAGAVAVYAVTRRRRRHTTRTTPGSGSAAGWHTGPPPPLPLAELDTRARQALVDTDDAVRTSQEELGFVAAQFGDEAARPFQEAVGSAKGELTAAFRLRQQLDDAHPEDDATRRRMLDEIVARCTAANRRLDAEADAFDRLRALERNAPQALAAARAQWTELNGRTVTAEATLTMMRQRYAPSAAAPVAADPGQAAERLLFAGNSLDRARTAVDASDNGAAAVQVRAAESALAQAGRLLTAVDRRATELAEATGRLPGALTETDSDLAEARGLLRGTAQEVPTGALQGRIARAEAVAAEVRAELAAGPVDPIDALRRVEEADAALDEALAGVREGEQGARRARELLAQAVLGARSAVGAASDYITTHRGAVGSEARTRLAEAQRQLRQAAEAAENAERAGAQAALTAAQRADALAREAQRLAEDDVRGFGNRYGGTPGGPPGFGGPGTGGGGVGGAVLGGILLGGLFGGGGGGFGGGRGGGFGGGFGGTGGSGPGSFGGGGTRGRMGGGRF